MAKCIISLDTMTEESVAQLVDSQQDGPQIKSFVFITEKEGEVDCEKNKQQILCALLKAPGIEQLTITGDRFGNCLPLQLPVNLPNLKVIKLQTTMNKDPLVSSINPIIISNWPKVCPTLTDFDILYGTNDHELEKERSKIHYLKEMVKVQKETANSGQKLFRISLNFRIWVSEVEFLIGLRMSGFQIRRLRLRVDDTCGCGDDQKKRFALELARFFGSQANFLESLSLHCNIGATNMLEMPPMLKLRKLSALFFSHKGDAAYVEPFQPFQPGQFPLLQKLKLSNYCERHRLFEDAGKFPSMEFLELDQSTQEVFLEEWYTHFPNLKKISLKPASYNQLNVVAKHMNHVEEIRIGIADFNQREAKKLIPALKSMKNLRIMFFEVFPEDNWLFELIVEESKARMFPQLEKITFRMRFEPDVFQRDILEAYHKEVDFDVTKAKCSHPGCECGL